MSTGLTSAVSDRQRINWNVETADMLREELRANPPDWSDTIAELRHEYESMTPEEKEAASRKMNADFPNWPIVTAAEFRRDAWKKRLKSLICPCQLLDALRNLAFRVFLSRAH